MSVGPTAGLDSGAAATRLGHECPRRFMRVGRLQRPARGEFPRPEARGCTRAGRGRPSPQALGPATIPEPRSQKTAAAPRLPGASPDIVPLAVGLPVSHEARARLVQVLAALGALEAGGVPLEVGGHPEDELVVDLTAAAHAHGRPGLLCQGRAPSSREAWLSGPRHPRPLRPQPNLLTLALSFKNCDHKEKKWAFERFKQLEKKMLLNL